MQPPRPHVSSSTGAMKRGLSGVAVGIIIGWITSPLLAAAFNPGHPDDTHATYWERVANAWWWRRRRLWGGA